MCDRVCVCVFVSVCVRGVRGVRRNSTFGPGNIDPESLQRHEQLQRRFHFMDR